MSKANSDYDIEKLEREYALDHGIDFEASFSATLV